MTRRLFWPTVMTILATPVLIGLGVWQLQRLEWKTDLIARIAAAETAAPQPIDEAVARSGAGAGADFARVLIRGAFDHGRERFVFATRKGKAGYLVFTPLLPDSVSDAARPLICDPALGASCAVWINRGFIPLDQKDPETRSAGQVSGQLAVSGFIRSPERPFRLVEMAPDVANNVYFSTSFVPSAYIEADATPNPGGLPKGRDLKELLATIPNNHASYAFTWLSLAFILIVVYAVYARGRRPATAANA
ncbi:MAG: SURF1 family cytochrome oxidase biogenesis protein [Hyphomicrobiales bacterium]|nr:SURF1 family cytochrome oxidase biogenesis protein [Hyphomicrobiales bacterium]